MIAAPIADNECERLADLRVLRVLDTPPEERFDRIVRLASRVFGVPIAYVALVDANRQWFKAKCGLTVDETGREVSFCGHAILNDRPLIISDARRDERFHDNPLVTGEPYIRFYAGYPLKGPNGHNVGTLCLASPEPRGLEAGSRAIFDELARLAERELNLFDLIQTQHDLLSTRRALARTQDRLSRELAEAAEYVRSQLPAPLTGAVRSESRYLASSQLGGDFFHYHWLDEHRLVAYLLDVCGHGIAPSLLALAVHSAVRRGGLAGAAPDDPSAVLSALSREFPMSENGDKFFTMWYGVFDARDRSLRCASGGHPPAALIDPHGVLHEVGEPGFVVGMMPDSPYETRECTVPPGSSLYVFSDGVFELQLPNDGMFGLDLFLDLLRRAPRDGAGSKVPAVIRQLQAVQDDDTFADDCSLLELRFD